MAQIAFVYGPAHGMLMEVETPHYEFYFPAMRRLSLLATRASELPDGPVPFDKHRYVRVDENIYRYSGIA